jgi:hypothetical protein
LANTPKRTSLGTVLKAQTTRAPRPFLAGQVPGLAQNIVESGPVHGEEDGVGVASRLGRRARVRVGACLARERLQLLLAP